MDGSITDKPLPAINTNVEAANASSPSLVVTPPPSAKPSSVGSSKPTSPTNVTPLVPVRSPLRPPARSPLRAAAAPKANPVLPNPELNKSQILAGPSTLASAPPVPAETNPNVTRSPKVESINVLLDKIQLGFEEASLLGLDDVAKGYDEAAMERTRHDSIVTTMTVDSSIEYASTLDYDYETGTVESRTTVMSIDPPPAALTKRVHALLELLSSERSYASDLALIRDIHIPLALGLPLPFSTSQTPPASSSSSSRTLSTSSSDESGNLGTAMTKDDVRIIFSNIAELAVFSDSFATKLEVALGNVLLEGRGPDHVGALFLETIPQFEKPYSAYITRHPSALGHLTSLQRTPALLRFLEKSRLYASSLSHAWDLPSLLIKPIQRLTKYSLLLTAIIADTPDRHPDKRNLRMARERMEEVAMNVNEGRRRWEVVKDILTGPQPSETTKKKGLNLSLAASVNVNRIKGFPKVAAPEFIEETVGILAAQKMMLRSEEYLRKLAKETLLWASTVAALTQQLRRWTMSFAAAIGLSSDQPSEAFDAFLAVLDEQLTPLSVDLRGVLKKRFLPLIAALVDSTRSPLRLIEAMQKLEPLHYGLLNLNFSKTRPPPALLDASQSYLALRGSLNADMPRFMQLLEKGMATIVLQLAEYQTLYWMDVRDRWSGLWNALRVEGEMNAGADETSRVWWERFQDVDEIIQHYHTLKPLHPEVAPPKKSKSESGLSSSYSRSGAAATTVVNSLNSLGAAPSMSLNSRPRAATSGDVSTDYRQSMGSSRSSQSKVASKDGHELDVIDYTLAGNNPAVPDLPPPPTLTRHRSVTNHEAVDPYREFGENDETIRGMDTITQKNNRTSSTQPASPTTTDLVPPYNPATPYPARDSSLRVTVPPRRGQSLKTNGDSDQDKTMYYCDVVHPCSPPPGVEYRDKPFFELEVGSRFAVVKEMGHPTTHPDLPLFVDDGDDCLLLVRRTDNVLGWALASFVMPVRAEA